MKRFFLIHWQSFCASACFAGKEIDESREHKAADAPQPASVKTGIGRCGQAEQYGKDRLFGVFLAVGEGFVVDACELFEAFRAEDFLFAIFGSMDERVLFFQAAIAFRAF